MPTMVKEYWTKADQFVTKNSVEWEALEPTTPEYYEWVAYFQWLGWKPQMISMVERHQISNILVPAKHPEWFDQGYSRG